MGGNPVCCAAGLAAMRYLEEHDLMGNAARAGRAFLDELGNLRETLPGIDEVRGLGLMIAFDTTDEIAQDIVKQGLEHGVIVNATGPRTVRLVPPLIITPGEVEKAVGLIADSLRAARQQ
jgi:acetylornithine/succinyldiaminopimelate/putrescine aminotransferase